MVTNKQLRERLLISKLNLHKPIINFAVCIDEYGNKNFRLASVTYSNQERKGEKFRNVTSANCS